MRHLHALACMDSAQNCQFADAVSASALAMHTVTGLRLALSPALTTLPLDHHQPREMTASPHEPVTKPAPDALRITQLRSHELSLQSVCYPGDRHRD